MHGNEATTLEASGRYAGSGVYSLVIKSVLVRGMENIGKVKLMAAWLASMEVAATQSVTVTTLYPIDKGEI